MESKYTYIYWNVKACHIWAFESFRKMYFEIICWNNNRNNSCFIQSWKYYSADNMFLFQTKNVKLFPKLFFCVYFCTLLYYPNVNLWCLLLIKKMEGKKYRKLFNHKNALLIILKYHRL